MRALIAIVVLSLLAAWSGSPTAGGIRFEETAEKAGLHFVTTNSPTPNKNQIETMVAGVALLDYDRDGYLDVYLVGGAAIPSLKKESPVYWNRLFHNNHDGTFTDVTEKAGVAGAGYGMGGPWVTTTMMLARPVCGERHRQPVIPQQRRWNVHGRYPGGGSTGCEAGWK